jgi:hypothetical protein
MRIISHVLLLGSAAMLVSACSSETEPTAADNAMEEYREAQMNAVMNANANVAETADARRERLREKAKTDPDAADAEAIDSMGQNEVIATAINSAGYLCARVISAYPLGGNINVECVENRNGRGRVKYRVDPNAGTVEPR